MELWEGLARAGVGAITLVDKDTVDMTNINRQIPALHSTLGKPKVSVMADRIRDINPNCVIQEIRLLLCRIQKWISQDMITS